MFGRKKQRIKRILIVEDEPLVAFDTEYFLSEEGFDIVATLDRVVDAIDCLERGIEIDLVLVDVQLADGSGIDVAKAAYRRDVRTLFVTGNCPADAREYADGCLTKPYTQRDLSRAIATIEAVLDGKRPKRLPGGFSLFRDTA